MNSIETSSPAKSSLLEKENAEIADLPSSDASALDALRALMGFSGSSPLPQGGLPNAGVSPEETAMPSDLADRFAGLISSLSKGASVPADLASVLSQVEEKHFQLGENLSRTPESLEQFGKLIEVLRSGIASGDLKAPGQQQGKENGFVSAALAEALRGAALNLQVAGPELGDESAALSAGVGDALRAKMLEEAASGILRNAAAGAQLSDVADGSEQPVPGMANLGQNILHSIDSQSAAAAAGKPGGVSPSERVEHVNALVNEMADRLLVTKPADGQIPEVRIKIADSIMPGTEVRVWKDQGGQLRVEFDTNDAYWARVLSESSTQLSQRLNDRFRSVEGAQVTVQHESGQPEDGRSRNRRNPWEQAQQENA